MRKIALFIVSASIGLMVHEGSGEGIKLAPAGANAQGNLSCSELLSRWKKTNQKQKYAAFAKGRALTITGMMGCGYSFKQKSQAVADALAMKYCRENARNPDGCYISDRTK